LTINPGVLTYLSSIKLSTCAEGFIVDPYNCAGFSMVVDNGKLIRAFLRQYILRIVTVFIEN
jgi:hypothetical protein